MERKQSLDLDRTRIGRSLFGYNRAQVDEYLRYFGEADSAGNDPRSHPGAHH